MHTKEHFRVTVRLVCFGLLLTATVFRLAYELHSGVLTKLLQPEPKQQTQQQEEQSYPTLFYTPPTERTSPVFSQEDSVSVLNWSGAQIDTIALLMQPTDFTLSEGPLVLIIHTHATEAYSETEGYRTTDTTQSVVRVGQALAERLNQNGIHTLHDTTLIDRSGYTDSYERAAEIIEAYLQEYPSIQMVIDLHRDAVTDENGTQLPLTASIGGEEAAQMLLVMGTDTAGLHHPNWQENLAFALKLQALCQQEAAGSFRDLNLRAERYNQHLTPHSILLEVGTAGNTLQQAITSAEFFADRLTELILGA